MKSSVADLIPALHQKLTQISLVQVEVGLEPVRTRRLYTVDVEQLLATAAQVALAALREEIKQLHAKSV